MVSCARATRGLRRPSLDVRSWRPIQVASPHKGREYEQVRKDHLYHAVSAVKITIIRRQRRVGHGVGT
jgi:hypothetical protein